MTPSHPTNPAKSSDRHTARTPALRRALTWSVLVALLLGLTGCPIKPPEHPEPEFPPCVKADGIVPAPNTKLDLAANPRPTFTVTFSKVMEPTTLTSEFIALISTEVDYYFLRDIETPPVSDSRLESIVPITVQVLTKGSEPTKITITPQTPLVAGKTYTLLLTKNLRDLLQDLGENKRTGSRPLNVCPDANGNWTGEVGDYKSGQSQLYPYPS